MSTVKGIKFCIIGKVQANLRGLNPNLRDLWNLIPLKFITSVISIKLPCFVLIPFLERDITSISWRIFLRILHKAQWRNYFPESFTQSVVDPFYNFFIFCKSIRSEKRTNMKYDVSFLLTLLPYKLNIAVKYVFQDMAV